MTTAEVRTAATLDAGTRASVLDGAAACERADGHPPLSEQTRLDLGGRTPEAVHLVASSDAGTVAGYAYVDLRDPRGETAAELELFVRPQHRHAGLGRALVTTALESAAGRRLEAWAHGTLPGAEHLADEFGFTPVRRLLRLVRTLSREPDAPPLPDGLALRAFTPSDLAVLTAINAAAFAGHPEQGRLTQDDLARRTAEPWFDSGDLLLLVGDDRAPVGFFWGKVDPGGEPGHGEVYVLGVDPDAAGRGLGTLLLTHGLRRLHHRGVRTVDLYVEADNDPALRLYRRQGFTDLSTDTRYAGPH